MESMFQELFGLPSLLTEYPEQVDDYFYLPSSDHRPTWNSDYSIQEQIGPPQKQNLPPLMKSKRQSNYVGLPRMPDEAFRKITLADGSANFQCTFPNCPKTYTRRGTNAKTHWMGHVQIKGYKCSKCAASFSRRNNFNLHTLNCTT